MNISFWLYPDGRLVAYPTHAAGAAKILGRDIRGDDEYDVNSILALGYIWIKLEGDQLKYMAFNGKTSEADKDRIEKINVFVKSKAFSSMYGDEEAEPV